MCGIAGYINFNKELVDENWLYQMGDSIAHRGPDDKGVHCEPHLGFVHRRLSIIDTSLAGHQPMVKANRYSMVYNGEIYNYKEFIKELNQKGYVFESNSDTEVLLYLYMEYGSKMLSRLNGMFAFAIWDNVKKELFLARDRMGVKPLFYYLDKGKMLFASEVKALFAGGVPPIIDDQQIPEWLFFRYVAGERTLYKNILQLLPGHSATLSLDGSFTFHRWYHLGEQIQNHSAISNPTEWFRETFFSSINYRMVSDVPVGILLSGGLDSSSVASALSHEHYSNISTFNIGFHNYYDDESAIARRYSNSLNFPFHTVYAQGDELALLLKKSIYQLDAPLTHLNDPQLLSISNYASKHVKVLLSGEGADELMGGYLRHKTFKLIHFKWQLKIMLSLLPKSFNNNRLHKLKRYLANDSGNQLIVSNASSFFEDDFKQLGIDHFGITNPYRAQVLEEARNIYPNSKVRQLLYYDQHTYLQSLNDRNDRSTMGASIECREPFLDYRLVEGLGTLNQDWLLKGRKGKHILVSSMKRDLPNYILNHRKIGLSVPWISLIQQSPELSHEWNTFSESRTFDNELLDSLNIRPYITLINQYQSSIYDQLILQLFMFHLWKQTYFTHFK